MQVSTAVISALHQQMEESSLHHYAAPPPSLHRTSWWSSDPTCESQREEELLRELFRLEANLSKKEEVLQAARRRGEQLAVTLRTAVDTEKAKVRDSHVVMRTIRPASSLEKLMCHLDRMHQFPT